MKEREVISSFKIDNQNEPMQSITKLNEKNSEYINEIDMCLEELLDN